ATSSCTAVAGRLAIAVRRRADFLGEVAEELVVEKALQVIEERDRLSAEEPNGLQLLDRERDAALLDARGFFRPRSRLERPHDATPCRENPRISHASAEPGRDNAELVLPSRVRLFRSSLLCFGYCGFARTPSALDVKEFFRPDDPRGKLLR